MKGLIRLSISGQTSTRWLNAFIGYQIERNVAFIEKYCANDPLIKSYSIPILADSQKYYYHSEESGLLAIPLLLTGIPDSTKASGILRTLRAWYEGMGAYPYAKISLPPVLSGDNVCLELLPGLEHKVGSYWVLYELNARNEQSISGLLGWNDELQSNYGNTRVSHIEDVVANGLFSDLMRCWPKSFGPRFRENVLRSHRHLTGYRVLCNGRWDSLEFELSSSEPWEHFPVGYDSFEEIPRKVSYSLDLVDFYPAGKIYSASCVREL